MLRHAGPAVIEGSLVPFALFAVSVRVVGLMAALLVALGWSLAALGRRVWRGHRVSGVLLLGTLTLICRTLLTVASGNMAIYFVPPLVTTLALAGAFAVSVPLGRPLSHHLAKDLWPIGDGVLGDPAAGRVFRRLCWFWAIVNLAKLGANLWLLNLLSASAYAVAKGGVSLTLIGGGLVVSYLWLRDPLGRFHAARPCGMCLLPVRST